jgi:hypothetical protein
MQVKSVAVTGSYIPEAANYSTENYSTLSQVWTWKVPERYIVHEAYLETEDGVKQI